MERDRLKISSKTFMRRNAASDPNIAAVSQHSFKHMGQCHITAGFYSTHEL